MEKIRLEAFNEIFNFFESSNSAMESKNLKLMYFYFVGSRNLLNEISGECVQTYLVDSMKPIRRELR